MSSEKESISITTDTSPTDTPRKILSQIYKGVGYFDKYGGSLLMSLLLVLAFTGVVLYLRIMSQLKAMRTDWASNRCSPGVLPFAGAIVWKPGQTFFEATAENFNGCLNVIQEEITGAFLEPVNYSMSALSSVAGDIQMDINLVRSKLNDMGDVLQTALNKVLTQMMGFIVPVQLTFMRMKDVLAKTHAVLATSIFSLLSGYLGLKSFLGAFVNVLIVGLIAATAIILPLIIFIFTWPIAIPMIVLYAAVAVPLAVIIGYISHIVDLTRTSVPKVPGGGVVRACLDKNTRMLMSDGSEKRIADISVGDILLYDGRVISTMQVSTQEMDMYYIGGIIVSGSHAMYVNGRWIYAYQHPAATRISKYYEPYVYCLNTESGAIHVDDLIFSDWNDLDDKEEEYIATKWDIPSEKMNPTELHTRFDTGYVDTTLVILANHSSKIISAVKPDDLLLGGNRVIAVVKMDGSNFCEEVRDQSGCHQTDAPILYHLVTKTAFMNLGTIETNTSVHDFNWNIEHLLIGYKEKRD